MENIKIVNYGPNDKKDNSYHIEYKEKTVSIQEATHIDKHSGKFNQSFGKENKEIEIEKYIEEFITGKDMESRIEHSVKNSIEKNNTLDKYVYNEASFQHELAEYLMDRLNRIDKNFVVQFERNIVDFGYECEKYPNNEFKKREIDIVIINQENEEKYAIELKYHYKKYGRVPDTMYECIKDMEFMYNCLKLGFKKTFSVAVVEDDSFYKGRVKTGIYRFFRDETPLSENENKAYLQRNDETTKNNSKIYIEEFKDGKLPISWKKIDENSNGRYYILKFDIK